MAHRIKSVKPLENVTILVVFTNGVEKTYDMRNLYPVFPQFKDFDIITGLFEQVQVDVGGYGISWNDELDLDAEEIWENGMETGAEIELSINEVLAENLIKARSQMKITQKELANITGIYQADISKIERGLANPSLSTLKRLADGMGLKLNISFSCKKK